jgi:hypothetical protein
MRKLREKGDGGKVKPEEATAKWSQWVKKYRSVWYDVYRIILSVRRMV